MKAARRRACAHPAVDCRACHGIWDPPRRRAFLALGTYGVDSFSTWCASTIPLLSPLDSGMCPPFGLELTPFTCSEHVPQGPVLHKRPGSTKEGISMSAGSLLLFPAHPRLRERKAWRRRVEHQSWERDKFRATSLFRNRLVAAAQASEEEPDHRHLDQCLARLHF